MFSIDVVNGRKQNDIMRKFQKSDVMSAGKQTDIILKFQKSDAVKVEGSKTTQFSNLKNVFEPESNSRGVSLEERLERSFSGGAPHCSGKHMFKENIDVQ